MTLVNIPICYMMLFIKSQFCTVNIISSKRWCVIAYFNKLNKLETQVYNRMSLNGEVMVSSSSSGIS